MRSERSKRCTLASFIFKPAFNAKSAEDHVPNGSWKSAPGNLEVKRTDYAGFKLQLSGTQSSTNIAPREMKAVRRGSGRVQQKSSEWWANGSLQDQIRDTA